MDNAGRIRVLRAARGLGQRELARMARVPPRVVDEIERGAYRDYENRLLKVLGYAPEWDDALQRMHILLVDAVEPCADECITWAYRAVRGAPDPDDESED